MADAPGVFGVQRVIGMGRRKLVSIVVGDVTSEERPHRRPVPQNRRDGDALALAPLMGSKPVLPP